ncbi:MAG: GxxExxY protein [Candidatus Binatia bacterium]
MREPEVETDRVAHSVIGAAIEVHRALGPGFLESVYEAAIDVELSARGIPFQRQMLVPLVYKGRHIADHRLDLVVASRVVVELKAVESVAPIHMAQVISYLAAAQLSVGLLINFRVPLLKHGIHRIVRS